MALGALPYKAVATGSSLDGNNVQLVALSIRDNNNVVKGTASIPYTDDSSFTDAVIAVIERQMVADGGKVAAAQAVLATLRVG